MKDSNYWKHRNLAMINYGKAGEAGPSDIEKKPNDAISVLSDWNRYAKQQDVYSINGTALSKLAPDGFKTMSDLRLFIKNNLFSNVDTDEQLITNALNHFNQGGIPTATYKTVNQINISSPSSVLLSEPNFKINFSQTKDGVLISEEDTYRKWMEKNGTKHERSVSEPFYAQTKSTYLFTKEGEIKLLDLQIDCPSRHLATVLDQREPSEQIMRAKGGSFIKNAVASFISKSWPDLRFKEEISVEPQNLFSPK